MVKVKYIYIFGRTQHVTDIYLFFDSICSNQECHTAVGWSGEKGGVNGKKEKRRRGKEEKAYTYTYIYTRPSSFAERKRNKKEKEKDGSHAKFGFG